MEPREHQRKRMKVNNERDRITNLPDQVLHHIFSFLDMKYVLQTSVLSRRWRYVWESLPFMEFKRSEFDTTRDFKNFMDQTLINRDKHSNILSFRISCLDNTVENTSIYTWVRTALRENVEKLSLELDFEERFQFPRSLYTSKSLTFLKLVSSHRSSMLRLSLPNSMSLPSLKTLFLNKIRFESVDIPNKIFSSCPVLENLVIRKCTFRQKHFDIIAPNLKHLVVENSGCIFKEICLDKQTIKIYAPSLVSFRCDDHILKHYCMEDLSSLGKAEISLDSYLYGPDGFLSFDDDIRKVCVLRMMEFLRALHNVEILTLSFWFIEVVSEAHVLLESMPTQFSNLRRLTLETSLSRDCVNLLTHLLENSPKLESIILEINEDYLEMQEILYPYLDKGFDSETIEAYWGEEVSLQCILHHLKYVEIRGVNGRLNELMFLKLLLKNATVLKKMVLYPEKESSHTRKLLNKVVDELLSLPRPSSGIAILLM